MYLCILYFNFNEMLSTSQYLSVELASTGIVVTCDATVPTNIMIQCDVNIITQEWPICVSRQLWGQHFLDTSRSDQFVYHDNYGGNISSTPAACTHWFSKTM